MTTTDEQQLAHVPDAPPDDASTPPESQVPPQEPVGRSDEVAPPSDHPTTPPVQPMHHQPAPDASLAEPAHPQLTLSTAMRAVKELHSSVVSSYYSPENHTTAWSTIGEIVSAVSVELDGFLFSVDKVVRGRIDSKLRIIASVQPVNQGSTNDVASLRLMYAGGSSVYVFPASEYNSNLFINTYSELAFSDSQQWLSHLIS